MGGISIGQLLIIAVIVLLLFGTKKLRGLGSDLGASIKGFKKAMNDEDRPAPRDTDSTGRDAEFTAHSLNDKPQPVKPDESKSKDKEQV